MKLLKNDNKRFIRTLAKGCLRANRNRNIIALIAIILTAMLFTSVTTVLQGAQDTIREQQLRQSGTRFMVSMKYMAEDKADFFLNHPAFAEAGLFRSVGMVINPELNNLTVNVGMADAVYADNCYMTPTTGRLPITGNEVACDAQVLRLLGVPDTIGTAFTMHYTVGNEQRQQEMTVCGIWQGQEHAKLTSILISEDFLLANLPPNAETEGMSNYTVYASFPTDDNISGQLDAVVAEAGYNPSAERGEVGFIVHNVSAAYQQSTTISTGAVLGAAVMILLIMLAGYLIIYNIFQISVMKDIRLYGQLKTVGTSPKQLRYIIRRQGLLLSAVGIPIGLVLGWLLGNALMPMIMSFSNYSDTRFMLPNLLMWVLAAAFSFITVWISVNRPGKAASRIAPVEALNYQEKPGKQNTHRGQASKYRLFNMAVANLSRSKGKTLLVVLSISLSILLFNSVLNVTGSFSKEKFVARYTPVDFNISSAALEDIHKVVPQALMDELDTLSGVTAMGKIWYHALPAEQEAEEVVHVDTVNGDPVDTDAPAYMAEDWLMAYGVDEGALNHMEVIEGTLDYEKLSTGNYVVTLLGTNENDEIESDMQKYHPGDKLNLTIRDGVTKEVEVMAVMGVNTNLLMDKSIGGYDYLGFSENVFKAMFPENTDPIHVVFNAAEGSFDSINAYLDSRSQDYNISVDTRLTAEAYFEETTSTMSAVGGILAGVFGLIGMMNLLNVILTGAVTRKHEFAVMRSVGMTREQLRKLFVYEGVLYAGLAGVSGLIISALISLTAVRGITEFFWFAEYRFILTPAVCAAVLCVVVAAIISFAVDRIWNNGSVVENLRAGE